MATAHTEDLASSAQQTADDASKWVIWLARLGYSAKGIVYFTTGLLAIQIVMGSGGETTGPSGALAAINRQWYGPVLLSIVMVGLFCYALWRVVEAWVDPEHKGSDINGIGTRLGYVVTGIFYCALGVEAARILLGSSSGGSGGSAEDWTATLMSQPFGRWLVAIAGVVVVGVGGYNLYRGYSAKFREKLKLSEMSQTEITWSTRAGRTGFAALGVTNLFVGGFLLVAAWRANPEEAGGLGEALGQLVQQPYGVWLLGLVALGLMAYGLFMFVLARYRQVFIENK